MWGGGSPLLDLAMAYEKAAAVVLAARPTYLVIAQVCGWEGGQGGYLGDGGSRGLVCGR